MLVGLALGAAAMSGLVCLSFIALGAAAGSLHYFAIMLDARQLVSGGSAVSIIGRRIGRFIMSGGLFVLAACSGPLPLIAAVAGFLAQRQWALGRFGTIE